MGVVPQSSRHVQAWRHIGQCGNTWDVYPLIELRLRRSDVKVSWFSAVFGGTVSPRNSSEYADGSPRPLVGSGSGAENEARRLLRFASSLGNVNRRCGTTPGKHIPPLSTDRSDRRPTGCACIAASRSYAETVTPATPPASAPAPRTRSMSPTGPTGCCSGPERVLIL